MDAREDILCKLLGTTVHVVVDRPVGHRHKTMVYPVNYGYIPGVFAGDGEEQDAYILGISEPVSSFDGQVIGAVRRKNDFEDKLIVAPTDMRFHQAEIAQAVHFQEQFFDCEIISLLEKSCGVLPYRINRQHKEYLIVYQKYSKTWSLPKGHMEAGETETETALRELYEETGLTAILDGASASVEYAISSAIRKQVVFFSGRVIGTPRVQEEEIERFRWVSEEELKDYLYPDTVDACAPLLR